MIRTTVSALVACAVAAGAVVGAATVSSAAESGSVTLTRIAGADRIATAVAVSQQSYDDGTASAVVLARHDAFADAVTGGPLAVAKDAPLLLTSSAKLDAGVAAEITRLLGEDGTVYLLGGTAALSAGVEDAVKELGFTVKRLSGADRYATSVSIAREIGEPEMLFLTTGQNFPDALSAGGAAGVTGGAVLLTDGAKLPSSIDAYLNENDEAGIVAVGGPAAKAFPDADEILSGADRYETSAAVARKFFPAKDAANPVEVVGLASGANFPDALSAVPFMASIGGPLLLTDPAALPKSVDAYLTSVAGGVSDVVVFGGKSAVTDAVAGKALTSVM